MLLEGRGFLCFCLFKANLVISDELVLQCPHLVLSLKNDLGTVEPELLLVQKFIDLPRIEVLGSLRAWLWQTVPCEEFGVVAHGLTEAILHVQPQNLCF